MGSTNLQSRKWLLTVNNPLDYSLNHAEIKNILHLFNPDYFCLVDEIATTGTRHTHIFIYSKSPIRFSTLKNRFPVAHIDKANGSVIENRDYLRKEGKWQGSDKEQTNLIDFSNCVGIDIGIFHKKVYSSQKGFPCFGLIMLNLAVLLTERNI